MTEVDLLTRATPLGVEASLVTEAGGTAIELALEPARRAGQLGRDFGDEPTFLLLEDAVLPDVIEAEVCGALLPDAPDYARGFIGLAWGVQGRGSAFEAFYIRPTNGLSLAPPPPRDRRAVQYFAYPDHKFDRLRETDPDRFEAGADVRPGRWHKLRLEFQGQGGRALVDGRLVLAWETSLLPRRPGGVGLWVDIGTRGRFRNLVVGKG